MYNAGDLVVFKSLGNPFAKFIGFFQRILGGTKRNYKVYHVGIMLNDIYYLHARYGSGVIIGDIRKNFKDCSVHRLDKALNEDEIAELSRFTDKHYGKHYETNLWEFIGSILDWFPDSKQDTSRFFCSELVAEFLQNIDRLPATPASNEYTPQDIANLDTWNSISY